MQHGTQVEEGNEKEDKVKEDADSGKVTKVTRTHKHTHPCTERDLVRAILREINKVKSGESSLVLGSRSVLQNWPEGNSHKGY